MDITFNYLAILSAAVASFVLGGMYVNLFRKQWAELNGFNKEEAQKKQKANPKGIIGIFLANLAMAFGLAFFVVALDVQNINDVLQLELWLFIGFVGPLTIAPVLWENKPISLWVFNNIINIVSLFAMIVILMLWQ